MQDTYNGYKADMRSLQGVLGMYKTPTRGMRWVQETYKGYESGTRPIELVKGGYEKPTRGTS